MQETTEQKQGRPVKIMRSSGQSIVDLHNNIKPELTALDHPDQETVPPLEQPAPFEKEVEGLGGDVIQAIGTFAEEVKTGKGLETETRSIPGRGPRSWFMERGKKLVRFKREP